MTKSQIAIEISKHEPHSAYTLFWDKISKKELEEELNKILTNKKIANNGTQKLKKFLNKK